VVKAQLYKNQEVYTTKHKVIFYYLKVEKTGNTSMKIKVKKKKLQYKKQVYMLNDIYGEAF